MEPMGKKVAVLVLRTRIFVGELGCVLQFVRRKRNEDAFSVAQGKRRRDTVNGVHSILPTIVLFSLLFNCKMEQLGVVDTVPLEPNLWWSQYQVEI